MQGFVVLAALALLAGTGRGDRMAAGPRAALFAHVSADRIQADTDGNGLFDNLEAALAAALPDQLMDVVVRYKPGRETAGERIADRVSRTLEADRSVVAQLTAMEIRRLMASGDVASIELDVLCDYCRDTSQASFGITKARADFGLDGNADGNANAYSAKDLVIAVIDSGIDIKHPDFAGGKVIGWKDFVGNKDQPYDDLGHGTQVASIAAGAVNNVSGVMVGGVAPGAALVGVKVGGAFGTPRLSQIAAALDWCVENKQQLGIRVVTLSTGDDLASDGTDVGCRAVDRASAAGLVVCVATSNSGPQTYTIGSPGAARGAITVGNMADLGSGKDGFALDLSSGRGPTADGRVKPDVCGPGVNIVTARANNTTLYARANGTSYAAPFVAGLAALMLQANPKLSPAEVKEILKSTAVHFGRSIQFGSLNRFSAAGENNDFGAGRVDGYAALMKASGKTGTPPAAPRHLYGEGFVPAANVIQRWEIPITDTQFPIAVTMLLDSADTNFLLFLYSPSGQALSGEGSYLRQGHAGGRPTVTGTYFLDVYSTNHAGGYSLDVSAGTGGP